MFVICCSYFHKQRNSNRVIHYSNCFSLSLSVCVYLFHSHTNVIYWWKKKLARNEKHDFNLQQNGELDFSVFFTSSVAVAFVQVMHLLLLTMIFFRAIIIFSHSAFMYVCYVCANRPCQCKRQSSRVRWFNSTYRYRYVYKYCTYF